MHGELVACASKNNNNNNDNSDSDYRVQTTIYDYAKRETSATTDETAKQCASAIAIFRHVVFFSRVRSGTRRRDTQGLRLRPQTRLIIIIIITSL